MIDRGDEHLKGAVFGRRFGDAFRDRLEERLEVVAFVNQLALGDAGFGIGVDDGKIRLLVARSQLDEKIERLVDDDFGARVLSVDLVDDDDRAQVEFERFAQHEARLRHDALGGIDEQEYALNHLQHALDLAAEIGVPRRVDDVELDVAMLDRGVLGQNRDAALALERVRVHDASCDGLTLSKDAALFEHGIDQRRLAVIDVGDDRDVSEVGTRFHSSSIITRGAVASLRLRAALGSEAALAHRKRPQSLGQHSGIEVGPEDRRRPQFGVRALI